MNHVKMAWRCSHYAYGTKSIINDMLAKFDPFFRTNLIGLRDKSKNEPFEYGMNRFTLYIWNQINYY